jgi:hypothetical protein
MLAAQTSVHPLIFCQGQAWMRNGALMQHLKQETFALSDAMRLTVGVQVRSKSQLPCSGL